MTHFRSRLVFILLSLLLSAVSAQAQVPDVTPGQRFGFDYKPADITAFQVTRFELQIDEGAWADIQIPPTANDAITQADHNTYAVTIPALTPGAHTYSIRACNAGGCGVAAPAFAFNVSIVPPGASNLRVLGGAAPGGEIPPGAH
jgi:hypothetical protein